MSDHQMNNPIREGKTRANVRPYDGSPRPKPPVAPPPMRKRKPEPIDFGNWSPIDSAPYGKKMFLVIGVFRDRNYITDQYAVWRTEGSDEFTRWPHQYPPTHWHPLPDITGLEELLK